MTTIKDLAKKAEVSVATVSMALNNKEGISKETRERILKLAEEMNYVPSTVAKALKTQSSRNIGIIVGQLTNAYSVDIIGAAEEVANTEGYNVFISGTGLDVKRVKEILEKYHKHMVDGILISVPIVPDEGILKEIRRLMASGIAVIVMTKSFQGYGIPSVVFREYEQVAHYLSQLVALGHKNIGMMGAEQGSDMNRDRLPIFKDTMKGYGLLNEDYMAYSSVDMFKAKQAAKKLLETKPDLTAIYAINDMLAIGVLQAASELGIRVPEELSIVGSDGIPYINFTTPNITTVITPRHEMGTVAATKLIQMIENKQYDTREDIVMPCTCFDGGSIAPACR